MDFVELKNTLQILTNAEISYSKIADVLGTYRSVISRRVKEKSQVKIDEMGRIADYFKINIESLRNNSLTNIGGVLYDIDKISNTNQNEDYIMDYYPEVFGSCGTGVFELSQTKEQIRVPKNALFTDLSKVKKYSVINAYGSSMSPFINDADKLIVEHWEGEQIIDNRVYVFCFDKEIFVKRLVKNINQLVIMSDNKEYDTIKLTGKDLNKIHIIGQIVGLMRNMR